MKLYHGSIIEINKPIVIDQQRLLDFGKGFYTTSNQKQAERWAVLKKRRMNTTQAVVNVYEFDKQVFKNQAFNLKIFKDASEEWLDFILTNRKSELKHAYDLVKGPVANDTLYATLSLYEVGLLTKKETIIRLKAHKLFDQISFHTENVLQFLHFIGSYQLHD